MTENNHPVSLGKPKWLRRRLPSGPQYEEVRALLKNNCLTTVCQEAQCPNQFECYSRGTATFMILGEKCTRNCMFCAVDHGPDGAPDLDEPERVAQAVKTMGLQYSVITSVTRDDLEDGGASLFAATVKAIRRQSPDTLVEILIPDLQGNWDALQTIVTAAPDVLNHNVETISRLYPTVRPQAVYHRSLELLAMVKRFDAKMITKSGIMLGLGESMEEILEVMDDLLAANCDILTLGQYLQPSKKHLAVNEFIHPENFAELKKIALTKGFIGVASGPSVRSSYEAGKLYRTVFQQQQK
ncbi:MAG: lipoyl synthase [Desulfocapsaceae bacterium]|nr:lipoyl synthase [Desulfocapsaceae bacterium]